MTTLGVLRGWAHEVVNRDGIPGWKARTESDVSAGDAAVRRALHDALCAIVVLEDGGEVETGRLVALRNRAAVALVPSLPPEIAWTIVLALERARVHCRLPGVPPAEGASAERRLSETLVEALQSVEEVRGNGKTALTLVGILGILATPVIRYAIPGAISLVAHHTSTLDDVPSDPAPVEHDVESPPDGVGTATPSPLPDAAHLPVPAARYPVPIELHRGDECAADAGICVLANGWLLPLAGTVTAPIRRDSAIAEALRDRADGVYRVLEVTSERRYQYVCTMRGAGGEARASVFEKRGEVISAVYANDAASILGNGDALPECRVEIETLS